MSISSILTYFGRNLIALLSFFKINDPYRLAAVFLLAFLIRLPFFINPVYSLEQSYWLTIGEALQWGTMYIDVWDSMAPLAASVYWLVVLVFGKSVLALNILGTLLNFFIAVLINNMFIKNKVYEHNTYLPAFVYIMLSSLSPSLSSFSPVQMGMAFVLMALGNLLGHVEFRAKRDEQILNIGLFQGVAVLFYFPLIIFIPITLLLFIVFTSTQSRRYFLFLTGSMLPIMFAFSYFWFVTGKAGYFTLHFIQPYLFPEYVDTDLVFMIKIALPVILFFVLGSASLSQQKRLNNYQIRLNRMFIVVTLLTLTIFLFTKEITPTLLIVFLPVVTFFMVHFLLLFKRGIVGEIVTVLFVSIIIFSLFDETRGLTGWYSGDNLTARKRATDEQEFSNGKYIMVLGEGKELYYRGSLGTPFFDWSLAAPFFNSLDHYDNQVFLLETIEERQPEVVIDYEEIWPQVTQRLPLIGQQYRQVRPRIWVKE